MSCKRISKKANKICTGQLNKLINIKLASITSSIDTNYSRSFEDKLTGIYARVDTTGGKVVFNSSNLERVSTHTFYIRYTDLIDLDIDYVIEYNDKNYMTLSIENLNEENQFIKIVASERGNKAIPVNQQ